MLNDYTSYSDIRAALGVDEDDISDETLGLPIYDDLLTQDLEDVDLTVVDTYTTTTAISSPTAAETRFLRACKLFATFSVARQLTSSLPLFAAKQMTDGKAQIQRFDNPYQETIKKVNEQYGLARSRLVTTLLAIGTTADTVVKTYFGVASPSTDPVTGS